MNLFIIETNYFNQNITNGIFWIETSLETQSFNILNCDQMLYILC